MPVPITSILHGNILPYILYYLYIHGSIHVCERKLEKHLYLTHAFGRTHCQHVAWGTHSEQMSSVPSDELWCTACGPNPEQAAGRCSAAGSRTAHPFSPSGLRFHRGSVWPLENFVWMESGCAVSVSSACSELRPCVPASFLLIAE